MEEAGAEEEEEVEEEDGVEAGTEEGSLVHSQSLHPGWTTETFLAKALM